MKPSIRNYLRVGKHHEWIIIVHMNQDFVDSYVQTSFTVRMVRLALASTSAINISGHPDPDCEILFTFGFNFLEITLKK